MPEQLSGSGVLAINGGSSSIKFSLYDAGEHLEWRWGGMVDRIGRPGTRLSFQERDGGVSGDEPVAADDLDEVVSFLVDWLGERAGHDALGAVGHRVVHGMGYTDPTLVTAELIEVLEGIEVCDPEHLPGEIALIRAFRARLREVPQVACFDTAFHRTMPKAARLLPIPRRYWEKGVERYGFHGLSYAYLLEELVRLTGPAEASGRVILAHLGSGASLAALRDGKSVDTSMGFTPAAGLVMGTRSGDLDPGLLGYLAGSEQLAPAEFTRMINHESGLLGISETSADIRDLLELEASDERAAEALGVFCYQARKWIGAFAAALEGLDTLVFAGGIGENSPDIRARICAGLRFLGIELDASRNSQNAPVISVNGSGVSVRVIPTDEQLMIARQTIQLLATSR